MFIFKIRKLTVLWSAIELSAWATVYQLKIKYDQDKFGGGFLDAFDTIKRAVSFPLEDKHVVNEHHVIPKSHDTTQKKMYHVIGLKQTRGIKNVTLKVAKKFVGVAVYWEE